MRRSTKSLPTTIDRINFSKQTSQFSGIKKKKIQQIVKHVFKKSYWLLCKDSGNLSGFSLAQTLLLHSKTYQTHSIRDSFTGAEQTIETSNFIAGHH